MTSQHRIIVCFVLWVLTLLSPLSKTFAQINEINSFDYAQRGFPGDDSVEDYYGIKVKVLPVSAMENPNLKEKFLGLPADQALRFFETRKWILSKLAFLLRGGRIAIGAAIGFKELVGKKNASVESDSFPLGLNEPDDQMEKTKIPLRDLGQPYVEGFLNSVNSLIWKDFGVFAKGNTKGVSTLFAFGGGIGLKSENKVLNAIRNRLAGRRPYIVFGVHINIGGNLKDREIYVEATLHKEVISKVFTVVTEAYVGVKPTPFVMYNEKGHEMDIRKGKGYYGGMLGSVLVNENYLTAGISYTLGYPTFPWGGVASMETDWTEVPLIRVTLSGKSWAFIRVREVFSSTIANYLKKRLNGSCNIF